MKIGDVVRLKSGGPDLTVLAVLLEEVARVGWFANGVFYDALIPVQVLEEEVKGRIST